MAIRFLQGQAITGTLSVSSTTTLAAATVSAPSTGDDSTRIPSTAWVKDQGFITSGSLPTVNNSTITFTAGTGLTGGGAITLNQSFNETVTFNNSITNNNQLTNGAGYTTNTGTVTSVGISHGGNAFSVGSAVTTSGTLAITMAGNSAQYVRGDGNLATFPSIPQGDITAVVAGSGISGGGTSGSVTITNADKGSSQAIFKNVAVSGQNTVIADSNNDTLTLVASGGMTITTNSSTDTITFNPNDDNDNYYVTGGNVTSGTVTLNRQGLGNVSFAINTSQITNGAGYTTNTGTTTASNTQTFTNKSGNISQWTNNSGYITSGSLPTVNNATITFTAGTNLTGGGVVTLNQASNETVTFNNSITNNNQLTNGAGYTTNTGTVTSVGLSAQGDALQITGTPVSGSGTLTINFQGDTDDYINGEGDIVAFPSIPQGDITAVVAGTGLSGGGTSGSVTLNNTITNNNQLSNGAGYTTNTGTTTPSNTQTFTNKSGNISQWTNDSGYTTSVGDITGVTAGSGMSGGGTSGTVTLTNADKGSSQNIYKNIAVSGQNTVIADSNNDTLTFVATGGMSITTNNATDTITFNPNDDNDNYYVTGASQSGGTLTLTRQGLSTLQATGFTNASNSQTFTNKAGNISQWTNDSGYITAGSLPTVNNATITLTAGTGLSGGGTITLNQSSNETVTFNNSITNNNQLTNGAGYTTNTGTTTASNSQTFTNKGGNISQWTNDSGYVTSSGGSMSSWTLKEGNGVETSNVTNGETVTFAQGAGIQTELTSTSSGGTLTISNTITNNNQLTNGAGYTTNTGTTTASNSQTFTNKGGNISQWTNNSGYITSGSLPTVNNATITLTAGTGLTGGGTITLNQSSNETVTFNNSITNNNQLTNGAGYTTNVGDITGVTAGTNMSGGGTSGTVTLNCTITNNNQLANGAGYVTSSGGSMSSWKITADSGGTATVDNAETVDIAGGTNITTSRSSNTVTITNGITNNNQLTNGAGYTTSVGDITGVTAGTGMSGGGTSGTVTLNCTITNNNQLTNGAGYTTNTGTTTASNSQTFTNKGGNISQWTNNSGYTTNTGTVTGSSGATNRIPFWSSLTNLSSSNDLSFNPTSGALILGGGVYEMVVSGDFLEMNNADEDLSTRIHGFGGDGRLTVGEGAVFTTSCGFYVPSGQGISVGTSATASNTIRSTGNIIAYYSDERLKDFKGVIPNALDKVCQIGGYYYEQNEKAAELGYENYERQVGVNAQEIQKIMPEVVEIAPISYNEEAEGVEYLTVDYAKLVPLLIESIKELKAEVDLLKNK